MALAAGPGRWRRGRGAGGGAGALAAGPGRWRRVRGAGGGAGPLAAGPGRWRRVRAAGGGSGALAAGPGRWRRVRGAGGGSGDHGDPGPASRVCRGRPCRPRLSTSATSVGRSGRFRTTEHGHGADRAQSARSRDRSCELIRHLLLRATSGWGRAVSVGSGRPGPPLGTSHHSARVTTRPGSPLGSGHHSARIGSGHHSARVSPSRRDSRPPPIGAPHPSTRG